MQNLKTIKKNKKSSEAVFIPYTPLNFSEIDRKAKNLADIIEARFEDLSEILLEYESYEVVEDETARTLDLLRSLKENKEYFKLRVGAITAFLPRNQPLYAFTCFVIIPSLMASEAHFRIPHSMRSFFPKMFALLDINKLFPNIFISSKQRIEFLTDRSAIIVNSKTKESTPVTDTVIFTGTSAHADQLRLVFDKQTLFIANGSGHNPIVINKDADLRKAVEAVITLQFYNQGQDCAAPNAVLVQKSILPNFLKMLRAEVSSVKVGHYRDKSCRIGPISDPKDLVRIQDFLIEHREWLDPQTQGIIRAHDAIVEPTIINKPLVLGGNFREIFAPIIFVQEYKNDTDLKYYFEDSHYAHGAMYVTLYGTSKYVKNLIGQNIGGKVLHKNSSFIHNTHLHALGLERGTKPYGGYGYGASSISINEKLIPMPTLPQRDIYEHVAKLILRKKTAKMYKAEFKQFTKIEYKNVQKLLRLQSSKENKQDEVGKFSDAAYFDLHSIKTGSVRYIKIEEDNIYYLLNEPNVKHIAALRSEDMKMIRALKKLLLRKSTISLDEFRTLMYAIAKDPKATEKGNRENQINFFQHVYQLLFGEKSGPQLAPFLLDVEQGKIDKLLAI
ncbi:MAG: aldehyde dehydrogenase family protein [Candidatus Paceibacterota bacterium]|jgi:lysyl-tRNA synthetase class 1